MLIRLEQQNAKPLVKWNDLLLGQWKGPDPLLTGSWGGACIFSTGCRFANLDPEQADSSCRSPPGTWFLHCHEHKEQEENSSVKAATENSHAPGAEGRASLTDGTQCAVPAGRRGKINIEIPAGLTAAAVPTLTRKWFYLLYFSLSTLSLWFFSLLMIPENSIYKWIIQVDLMKNVCFHLA